MINDGFSAKEISIKYKIKIDKECTEDSEIIEKRYSIDEEGREHVKIINHCENCKIKNL
jgi:hypothetical protein